jgi:hypothetical protein
MSALFLLVIMPHCSIGEVLLLEVKTEVEKIGLTAKFSASSR